MEKSTQQQLNVAPNRSEDFEIDLKQVLNLIKYSYKLIAIIVSIFFLLGIYYAHTRPPVYRSIAMIEVSSPADTMGSEGGSSVLSGLLSSQASSAEVEKVLLQTPYLLGAAVRQLNLDISVSPHYSGFFARKLARFKPYSGSVSVSFLKLPNSLLAKPLILTVKNNNQYSLSTYSGKKIMDGLGGQLESTNYFSEPFQIQVAALNAKPGTQFDVVKQPVSDVANNIAGSLDIKMEGDNTGILQLSYTSGDREQAQKLLNTVLMVAVAKNIKTDSQEAARTLQFISHQLPISKKHLQKAEIKLEKYSVKTGVFNTKTEGGLLELRIHNLHSILENLKFKKMVLLQKYTQLHPLVIAITQKENEVRSQIKKIKAQMDQLPTTGEKEISMQREAKIQAEIYTALVESAQNMEMMKASTVSNVQILSLASYPVSRIPVKKIEIILSSVLLGLMISLGFIFVRHLLSPVIEDPDDVERALGISVAAIIPYSQQQMNYNRRVKRNKLYMNTHPFLLLRENPNDISIESIRSLRTTIQMALLEAKNNVITITGCSPSIGKSFISSNLSALLSDLGKHVIVVDADIRLGKMNQCFGKAKTPGLSTYLKNESTLEQIIQNVFPERLDFIATGLYPENPSELLSHASLNELIQTLSRRYDLVIIDTPPILAVTDPALILRHTAINFMVLGVGKDQMKEVRYAKNILEKAGVELTGVIFNHVHQQKAGFGHNYGYTNYHYHYGQNK